MSKRRKKTEDEILENSSSTELPEDSVEKIQLIEFSEEVTLEEETLEPTPDILPEVRGLEEVAVTLDEVAYHEAEDEHTVSEEVSVPAPHISAPSQTAVKYSRGRRMRNPRNWKYLPKNRTKR